jgi:carboxyl-terminal processing protease
MPFPSAAARALLIGSAILLAPGAASASAPVPAAVAPSPFDELETFMRVYERVKSSYVKPVDDHILIKGAIDGMLAALDPHSSYAEGLDYSDLQIISDGNYGGLGVVTTVDDGLVKVVSTTEDTPAWRAGIKSGDYITHVDGKLMYGLDLDEATAKLRGKPGSQVQVTVRRQGSPKPMVLSLVRGIIDVAPVKWEVRDNVGIINLNVFNGKSGEETRKAIEKIDAATHGRATGYILDLRSNGGGVLGEAVEIADLFLDQGEIVSQRGRTGDGIERYYARPGDLTNGRPLIVLIDSGSASASEIVAGALQDHHRGLLLGERSFGKGSVQSIYQMGRERALRLTTDLYYLPSGRSIQAGGIEPDIVVPQLSDGDRDARFDVREADLRQHLIAEAGDDDALLRREDPPSPRFSVTAAELEKRGVKDFQLDYAVDVIRRLDPANLAESPIAGARPTSG